MALSGIDRHNAVNKLIGFALRDGRVPLGDSLILVSGRAGFELVQKSVIAAIPMLAAVGAPSSLAVEVELLFGMTLVVFLRGERFKRLFRGLENSVKLRIHRNSLRLRLNRSDVEHFRKAGICADTLRFGPGSQLTYTLEASSRWTVIEARYHQDCIRILLPLEMGQQWADSDQVSLSLNRADDSGPSVLVEKDFQCLHSGERNPSDDADNFPNPSADDEGQ